MVFVLFRNIMKKIPTFSRTAIVSMKFDIFQVPKFNLIWSQMKHTNTQNSSLTWRFLIVDWHFLLQGESNIDLFGGNSNWRGPIWFPVNYLLIESLQRFHRFVSSHSLCISSTFTKFDFDLFVVIDTMARHCKWSIQQDQGIWWVLIKLL